MKFLFGPVQSRRLGVSLGIDLLPFKTCSFDCIYCECGCSAELTTTRSEFFPTDEVIGELDAYLSRGPELDFVTFSGSGEPTLHSGIGRIIDFMKEKYPRYKVAVLTNGTLLGEVSVQNEISKADVVIPSLDGATDKSFEKICRPDPSIHVDHVIDGIALFRKMYKGILIIEIFIVPGINDTDDELSALKNACARINPDSIQLNSLARPGCVEWIEIPSFEQLRKIKDFLSPLPVQLITKKSSDGVGSISPEDLREGIISLLRRRAATLGDITLTLGINARDAENVIGDLLSKNKIGMTAITGEEYYILKITDEYKKG